MMFYNLFPIRPIVLLIIVLSLPILSYGEVCQYESINQQISCLRNLGVSVNEFTEAYLRWVSDLKTQLEQFNKEEARCEILRWRSEHYGQSSVLREIREKCEGPVLEDRLRRFNAMRRNYITTKQRYEKIQQYYTIAKELLDVLETRQRQLEREYDEYDKGGFSRY